MGERSELKGQEKAGAQLAQHRVSTGCIPVSTLYHTRNEYCVKLWSQFFKAVAASPFPD